MISPWYWVSSGLFVDSQSDSVTQSVTKWSSQIRSPSSKKAFATFNLSDYNTHCMVPAVTVQGNPDRQAYWLLRCHSLCISQLLTLKTLPVLSVMSGCHSLCICQLLTLKTLSVLSVMLGCHSLCISQLLTLRTLLVLSVMLGCHSLCISQLPTLRTLPVLSVMQAFYINEHSVVVTRHTASMLVNCFLFSLLFLLSQKGQPLPKWSPLRRKRNVVSFWEGV